MTLPSPGAEPSSASAPELTPARFCAELWKVADPGHTVEFWFSADLPPEPGAKKGKKKVRFYFQTVANIIADCDSIQTILTLENRKCWNVYHSVNPRVRQAPTRSGSGRNEDVAAYVALWVDLDWHDGNETAVRTRVQATLHDLKEQSLYPSIVIESGYGLHFYWLLDKACVHDPVADPNAERSPARRACAGLQDYFKGSDPINDPRRVLRWPGLANHRIAGQYPICTIKEASWQRYPIEAFDSFTIDPGRTHEEVTNEEEARAINEEMQRLAGSGAIAPSKDPDVERVKAGVEEGGRNVAAATMAGHYLARDIAPDSVWLLLVEWNKRNRPPLEEDELKTTFNSMRKKDDRQRERNQQELKNFEAAVAEAPKPAPPQVAPPAPAVVESPPQDNPIADIADGISDNFKEAAERICSYYTYRMPSRATAYIPVCDWNRRNKPPIDSKILDAVFDAKWDRAEYERAEQRARKKDAKEKEKREGAPKHPEDRGAVWFDEDGEFIPPLMAQHLAREHGFLSTPIGTDGKGVDLFTYKNGSFRAKGASFARAEVVRLLGTFVRRVRIDEVIELLTEYVKMEYDLINPQALDLINVKNGMLNWCTGELLPHDRKYLSTLQLNAVWNPEAKSEALEKFLGEVFPPDALLLAEELCGYLTVPDTSFQKCFVTVGSGGNGKGTFLKVLRAMLGKANVSEMSIHEIEGDRFATGTMADKLANICHDLDPRLLESTGRFKSIVSGDPISAEQKFKARYSFEPFARLVFSANQFPRSMDRSEAFFRRLIFIPFPNRFDDKPSCVADLDKQLSSNPVVLTSLLNHAIKGLRRLRENKKFTMPASSLAEIESYRRECNSAYDFIVEHCAFEPDQWLAKKTMYQTYQVWCIDEGMKAMSSKHFVKALDGINGLKMVQRDGYPGWKGLSWKGGQAPPTSRSEIGKIFEKEGSTDF